MSTEEKLLKKNQLDILRYGELCITIQEFILGLRDSMQSHSSNNAKSLQDS